MSRHNIADNCW